MDKLPKVTIIMYFDQDNKLSLGFNVPMNGNCNGLSVIADRYHNGMFLGLKFVHSSQWFRELHINVSDMYQNIDLSDLTNIKTLCKR